MFSNNKFFAGFLLLYFIARISFFLVFPIYPDEIAVDWWITSDLNKSPNIIIACNNFLTKHSEFLNIFRNIEIIQNDLIGYIRIKTLFYYLIFIISLIFIYSKSKDIKYIFLGLITTFSPLSITFILNRPEGFIFYFVFYYLFSQISENKAKKIFLLFSVYFFILASISHPKTLYFSIIYLYGINTKIIFLVFVGLMNIFSYKYWSIRMACSDPEILKFYSEFNINPLMMFTDFIEYFRSLYHHNFCTGPNFNSCRWSRFFNNSYFTSQSDIGVYATIPKNYLFQNLPKLIYLSLFLITLFLLIKRIIFNNIKIIFLILPLIIHLLHNRTQNFYDLSFWYVYIFALFLFFFPKNLNGFSKIFIVIILSLSLRNDYNYFYVDYFKGYQGPGLTMKFLNSELKILRSNGYNENYFSEFDILVVDDSTYRFFSNKNKYLITYFSLRNKNMLDTILSTRKIAIVSRCVYFEEYNLYSLNPNIVKINNVESLCIYTGKN